MTLRATDGAAESPWMDSRRVSRGDSVSLYFEKSQTVSLTIEEKNEI